LLKWEDRLRGHPYYVRAATNAISIYIKLHDDPNSANETEGVDGVNDAERKKAIKKAKKAAKKQEEQNNANADAKDGKKDEDPKGETLVKTDKPLEEAVKFLKPLQELSPTLLQTQLLAFDVHVRRGISYDRHSTDCRQVFPSTWSFECSQ